MGCGGEKGKEKELEVRAARHAWSIAGREAVGRWRALVGENRR